MFGILFKSLLKEKSDMLQDKSPDDLELDNIDFSSLLGLKKKVKKRLRQKRIVAKDVDKHDELQDFD